MVPEEFELNSSMPAVQFLTKCRDPDLLHPSDHSIQPRLNTSLTNLHPWKGLPPVANVVLPRRLLEMANTLNGMR